MAYSFNQDLCSHGKIAFRTTTLAISFTALAVHIKVHPKLLRKVPFVLQIANLNNSGKLQVSFSL